MALRRGQVDEFGDGAPFRVLDNIEGEHIDLLHAPVRPMVLTSGEPHLYAVNTHDSTVVHFDASLQALQTFRVPWGPVSIGLWTEPLSGEDRLLVVTRGNSALAQLDRETGQIVQLLRLPAEPADLLVDHQRHHDGQ